MQSVNVPPTSIQNCQLSAICAPQNLMESADRVFRGSYRSELSRLGAYVITRLLSHHPTVRSANSLRHEAVCVEGATS